ncbi:MAG: hypothetical protein BECKG1743D_GA0114223_103912 [Candidatus Kentron sp. G]|nr:MAG: hypothetical protein BECKG1743F_GA0114225_104922 [Candidatus Kentron sp. G]VFN02310.1 MAG: hypothetical protein BECKG1743E_GA0114224_104932 [Candidatus Kentron sp. G]VFN02705.1 MAG: hypothetical protein BECKG1743D_GA0114223_103912 [Candidatus Kentron sp. G]
MTRLRALRVIIRPLAHGLKRTLARRLPLLLHAYRRAPRVDDRASFVTGFITGTVFTLSVVTFVLTIWPEFTIRDNPGTSLASPIQPSILETVSSSRQPGPNSPAGTISYSYRPNREPARSPAGAISHGSGRGPLSGNTPLTNIAFTLWPKDGENTIIDPGPILAAIWQGKSQRAQRYLDWQRARGRTLAEGDRILLTDLLSAMAAHKAGNWELATVRYGRARKNIGPGAKTVKNHVELLYWLSFAMRRYTENDHPNAIENLQFSRPERVSDITAFERGFYRRTAELIAELALKPGNREKTGTRAQRKTNNSATNISSPAPASRRVNGRTALGEGDNAPTGSLNQSDVAHPAGSPKTAIIPEMIPLPAGRFRMGDIHGRATE